MPDPSIPDGYSTVSPYLIVGGAAATIDFCRAVFGADEIRRFEADNGGIRHAEIRIGDSVVMLGDAGPGWPPVATHIHLYVDDVDEVYRRALQAGASSVLEPVRRGGEEDCRGGVTDAGGTTWWIAT